MEFVVGKKNDSAASSSRWMAVYVRRANMSPVANAYCSVAVEIGDWRRRRNRRE